MFPQNFDLSRVPFSDTEAAAREASALAAIAEDAGSRESLQAIRAAVAAALMDAPRPDVSLKNVGRVVRASADAAAFFSRLEGEPRSVEILLRLFTPSPFLTQVLLRDPDLLDEFGVGRSLTRFRSRDELREAAAGRLEQFRRRELARIAACDTFALLNLKTTTLQLSLLADAVVQAALSETAGAASTDGFFVLALGKLGGEELNYSSDIDLVFVADDPMTHLPVARRLVRRLSQSGAEGFLYRVDARLRPWGSGGPLVTGAGPYRDYLAGPAAAWERQAMLKARPIAGDIGAGRRFLEELSPVLFEDPAGAVRQGVSEMKARIESSLPDPAADVKAGPGSIRDVEFVAQCLQRIHGREHPTLRTPNTLDALTRLVDHGFLGGDEFRGLTEAYVFLRVVEHALQLRHDVATHALPDDPQELAALARRLDFSDTAAFARHHRSHTSAVRRAYERHVLGKEAAFVDQAVAEADPEGDALPPVPSPGELVVDWGARVESRTHGAERLVRFALDDLPGALSTLCGLLQAVGADIRDGHAESRHAGGRDVLRVTLRVTGEALPEGGAFRDQLRPLLGLLEKGRADEARARLTDRIADSLGPSSSATLLPVEISIENQPGAAETTMSIRGADTPGFLYELTGALDAAGGRVVELDIGQESGRVRDVLRVVRQDGSRFDDPARMHELRATIVLVKHFTRLLPASPNPRTALVHFREFVDGLFRRPGWIRDLASLQSSETLGALARLLGMSDFLWDDFLRLQHENLFPVVRDVEELREPRSLDWLRGTLAAEIAFAPPAPGGDEGWVDALNAFKDRELLRADLRHILNVEEAFGQFSSDLTDVADVVLEATLERLLSDEFDGPRPPVCLAALGKCGGRELGFASDIEVMLIYEGPAEDGRRFGDVAERLRRVIRSRRDGVFELDFRLRPHGEAGPAAVSLRSFREYFHPDGPAWPYERQALVKLRPVAGDAAFGRDVVAARDEAVYSGRPFDVAAMRALREKQVRQHVTADLVHSKLGRGGLVDVEYFVQGLQITHGHTDPSLRPTNTRAAMRALEAAGIMNHDERIRLRDAYRFLRRLIDGLRMVRGNARDLAVPPPGSEERQFLARRLSADDRGGEFSAALEHHMSVVTQMSETLESRIG